jgi:hypothetical protein
MSKVNLGSGPLRAADSISSAAHQTRGQMGSFAACSKTRRINGTIGE